jgi:integrase
MAVEAGRHGPNDPVRRDLGPAVEAQSQLAETPYALRHAAVSTWLNAGVGPQVAEWAGHSVEVLLRVYAKRIAGQQDEAKRASWKPPDRA